jgi:N-acyl-D-aspartate/D-glutamate deacylase
MPLEALRAGVPCDWTTTAEYLDRIEGSLAINAGFMVGHSALRRLVMGPAATERQADQAEIGAMTSLLRDGLRAGGIGFSSSWGRVHRDGDGVPVPSRHASPDELVTLAAVCREFPGTSLEFIPPRTEAFDDAMRELLTRMSAAAGRPLNWNVMRVTMATLDEVHGVLETGTYARRHDADVVALTMPIPSRARFSFATGFVLDALPGWDTVMHLPPADKLAALRDPDTRRRLAESAASARDALAELAEWDARVISETFHPEVDRYQGRVVGDIAREEGKSAFDALLDIVCADGLLTTFTRLPSLPSEDDWKASVSVWREGGALIGASDAGAHLDFVAYYDYPVYVIEHAVRRYGVLPLEEAVHLMTEVPARFYGLRDRGRIAEGQWADIVVFDETTVASGPMRTRFDLPAGAGRLYCEPVGVDQVLVNGEVIVEEGQLTGTRPGRLLRSGRDTTAPQSL